MPFQPRSPNETYGQVIENLSSGIDRLTNFVSGSFNDRLAASYSEQIREAELKALAAELAGYVDYAGKTLTEEDLQALGVENVDPDEINQYMSDEQLDNLAANLSVSRDPGSRARGTVVVQTSDDTVRIPEGYEFGVKIDNTDEYRSYLVDADEDGVISEDSTAFIQPESGSTEVEVPVIANDYGAEYNVGPESITYIPTPKPGIQGVSNPGSTDGGRNEQENPDLREDVKVALVSSAEGGTTDGIKRYIEENSDDVNNVGIDEFFDEDPPFVDVVVEGGNENTILDLIDTSRPAGIRHNLVRPTGIQIGVYSQVIGEGVDTTGVETDISRYLSQLSVSSRFYSSELLSDIYTADTEISSVASVSTYVSKIVEEQHEYDETQSVYPLRFGRFGFVSNEQHRFINQTETLTFETYIDGFNSGSIKVVATVEEDDTELVRGSGEDYTIIQDDDGTNIGIEFVGNTLPDELTTVQITYSHDNWTVDLIQDEEENEFTEGTDYKVIDDDGDGHYDAIQWIDGGSSPPTGERFHVNYTPLRSFRGDLSADDRELFMPSDGWITVDEIQE